MRVGSLFSGVGLLDYGLHLAGMQHAFLCEADPWRREILEKRWPGVPVYDDIRTFDGEEWRGRVDAVVGGFPCKGASSAGKREGFGHPETVLWREMRRVISEVRPRYCVVENVAAILSLRGGSVWGEVLGDLAALGYDAVWDCLPASAFGAPHQRDRVFLVATYSTRIAKREPPDETHAISASRNARTQPVGGVRRIAPDADLESGAERDERTQARKQAPRGYDARGCGVPVEWGEYGPAIRRWERTTRPAPAPLLRVRGVDDGSAAGLDGPERRTNRKRLSACGDGVLVAAGWTAGMYVRCRAEQEREA